jgi:hypothetical protein
MEVQEAWQKVKGSLLQPIELPTAPTGKSPPKWFEASLEGDCILISPAKINKPSCSLKFGRRISQKDFGKVFPFYARRAAGEAVSRQVTEITRNQVYIYSLIRYLVQSEKIPEYLVH